MERINDPLLPVGDSKTRNNHILNSILLGCAIFFILFFNTEAPYSLSVLGYFFIYIIFLFACLLSPLIITRLREKISILIVIVIFFILFILNTYAPSISIVSIIFSPIALELLWIAAGSFVFCVSDKSNIGTSFGIFFAVTQLLEGLNNFFLTGVNDNGYIVMFIIFLIVSIILILLLGNPLRANIENIHHQDILDEFLSPISVIGSTKFLYTILSILFIGFSSVVYPIGLTNLGGLSNSLDNGFFDSNNFLGTLGIVGLLASFLTGFLFDRIKKLFVIIVLFIFGLVTSVICFMYIYMDNSTVDINHDYYYAAMIGYTVVKYGLLVFIYSIIGHLFHKKSISANASIRIFQLLGTILSFILSNWVSYLLSFYVFTALLIGGCLSLAFFAHKHHF